MTTAATRRILVIGDVIDDTVVIPSATIRRDTDTPSVIRRTAGGSAANTATWLAALGADVAFTGAVGRGDVDRHSALMPGVEVHLQAVDAPTGAIVVLVEGAARSMLTDRGANAHLDLAAVPDALLASSAHVHLTGHAMAASDGSAFARLIRRAKDAAATVSVSPGSVAYIDALGSDRFRRVIAGADIVFASAAEVQALTGTEALDEAGARLAPAVVVVTRGAEGVSVLGRSVPAVEAAEVVDPTGAGDAFCAGFLASWVHDGDAVAAARAGTVVAARAVGTIGARPV